MPYSYPHPDKKPTSERPVGVPDGAPREYEFEIERRLVPMPRMTGGQIEHHKLSTRKWGLGDPDVQRYYSFCADVRGAFLDKFQSLAFIASNMVNFKKPFVVDPGLKGVAAFVKAWMRFKSKSKGQCNHGDPDNIMKSIIDALFGGHIRRADYHVAPQVMDMDCNAEEPGATIAIEFPVR